MFPIFVIAIGLAILAFGKRLAVLGAAVGALWSCSCCASSLDKQQPPACPSHSHFAGCDSVPVAGFAKGIVSIVLIVLGALAGAAIVLGFLDLFGTATGLLDWILALIGGVIGVILVQRFKDWAMIILAGLVGGLLVTRGLSEWLPFLKEGV